MANKNKPKGLLDSLDDLDDISTNKSKSEGIKNRTKLKLDIDKLTEQERHEYAIGKYKGAKIEKKITTVVGSVDATPYSARLRSKEWYKDKSKAAKTLLEIYKKKRLSTVSTALIKKNFKIIQDLASQKVYTPKAFKQAFESGYKHGELFSVKGVYNIVLAFQRATDAFGGSYKEILSSKCSVHLEIGSTNHEQSERFVNTYVQKSKKENGSPVIPNGHNGHKKEDKKRGQKDQGGNTNKSAYLYASTTTTGIVPGSDKFTEGIGAARTSTALIESYEGSGLEAFLVGLNAMPQEKRQGALDAVFNKLGKEDPEKAAKLLKEIINNKKDELRKGIIDQLKEKVRAASGDEKKYWEIKLLFLDSENPGTMRKIVKLFGEINIDALPEDLKVSAKEEKESLDLSLRQSVSADIVETAQLSLDARFKDVNANDTWFVKSLKELKDIYLTQGSSSISERMKSGVDTDAEVYIASSHMMEALRLLITYQYPQDVKKGVKIQNPIKHYHEALARGEIKEIKLPEGQSAVVKDVLKDKEEVVTGKIDLGNLFCDLSEEDRLFNEFQTGKERVGKMGIWTTIKNTRDAVMETVLPKGPWSKYAGYATLVTPLVGAGLLYQVLPDAFAEDQTAFMEKGEQGMTESSSELFPPLGEIGQFMKENVSGNKDKLGAVERLQLIKVENLIRLGSYDEAKTILVGILKSSLDKKKKIDPQKITDSDEDYKEIYEDYGDKMKAQIRLQLKAQGLDGDNFPKNKFPCSNGGKCGNYLQYIDDKVKEVLKTRVFVMREDEVANSFTDEEKSKMTKFEQESLEQLNYLNGHTYKTLWMTKEHADIAIEVAKMVTEIVLIEVATMGMGTYAAAASGAARAGSLAMKAGEVARWSGRGGRAIKWVAEGGSFAARGTKSLVHAAAFVQMQNIMNGGEINMMTLQGWEQYAIETAKMAGTLAVLGKTQAFLKGETTGAIKAARSIRRGEKLTRLQKVNPLTSIGRTSNWLGKANKALRRRGRLGTGAVTAVEIEVEIGAMEALRRAEFSIGKNAGDAVKFITGKEYESLKELHDETLAAKEVDAWGSFAHTAGVVLGLRTWGATTKRFTPPKSRLSGRRSSKRSRKPRRGMGERAVEAAKLAGSRVTRKAGEVLQKGRDSVRKRRKNAAGEAATLDSQEVLTGVVQGRQKGESPEPAKPPKPPTEPATKMESSSSPEASKRLRRISKEGLKDYIAKEIRTKLNSLQQRLDTSIQQHEVNEHQMSIDEIKADKLFKNGDYKKSLEEYLKLNRSFLNQGGLSGDRLRIVLKMQRSVLSIVKQTHVKTVKCEGGSSVTMRGLANQIHLLSQAKGDISLANDIIVFTHSIYPSIRALNSFKSKDQVSSSVESVKQKIKNGEDFTEYSSDLLKDYPRMAIIENDPSYLMRAKEEIIKHTKGNFDKDVYNCSYLIEGLKLFGEHRAIIDLYEKLGLKKDVTLARAYEEVGKYNEAVDVYDELLLSKKRVYWNSGDGPMTPNVPTSMLKGLRARAVKSASTKSPDTTPGQEHVNQGNFPTETKITKYPRVTSRLAPQEVRRSSDVAMVGDLHGNYEAFKGNVKHLELVNENGDWVAGNTKVVFHGDVLGDRNLSSLETFAAIFKMQKQARKQGGDVILLAGNHENFAISYLTGRPIKEYKFNKLTGEIDLQYNKVSDYGRAAMGVSEFSKFRNGNNSTTPTEILENMRMDPEGRKILKRMTSMKLIEQIDDTIFLHTELTPKIFELLSQKGKSLQENIDYINETYQHGLKHLLLGKGDLPADYDKVASAFLSTENRKYSATPEEETFLRDSGVKLVVHGHSDKGPESYRKGELEILGVDNSYGKDDDPSKTEYSTGKIGMSGKLSRK